MRETATLDAALREEAEVGKSKSLRRNGFVPAVVYGEKKKTLALKIERSHLIRFMHVHRGGENIVITLRVAAGKKTDEKSVLISEVQKHPVSDDILHVDFHEISLTEHIKVKVPIAAKGDAVGVKQDGGVLEQVLWEVEVECLPTQIPDRFTVDVTAMKIGDGVHVKDLQVPADVEVRHDPESIVLSIVPPHKEEPVPEAVAEGEAQPIEPEVIKKEKKLEEEGPAAEGAAPEKEKEKPKKEK